MKKTVEIPLPQIPARTPSEAAQTGSSPPSSARRSDRKSGEASRPKRSYNVDFTEDAKEGVNKNKRPNDYNATNNNGDDGGVQSAKRRCEQPSSPFRYVQGSSGGYFVLPIRQARSCPCGSTDEEEEEEEVYNECWRREGLSRGHEYGGGRQDGRASWRRTAPRRSMSVSPSVEEADHGRFVGCHAATRPRPHATLLDGWKTPRILKKMNAQWVGLKKKVVWKLSGGL